MGIGGWNKERLPQHQGTLKNLASPPQSLPPPSHQERGYLEQRGALPTGILAATGISSPNTEEC